MILELDCGNTRIKWRVLRERGELYAKGVSNSLECFVSQVAALGLDIIFCRVSSVRGKRFNSELEQALWSNFLIKPSYALSVAKLGLLRNGYTDPGSLGVDRWLAILVSFNVSRSACLVIDAGTAITCDFVTVEGLYLGGTIAPGFTLLASALSANTQLPMDVRLKKIANPATNTQEAISVGVQVMVEGLVQNQFAQAAKLLGASFECFITGGDADVIAELLPCGQIVPDLVLDGLAYACPYSPRM